MFKHWPRIAAAALVVGLLPTSLRAQDIEVLIALPAPTLTFSSAFIAEDAGFYKNEGLKASHRILVGVASANAVISAAARSLLASPSPPTAIFAANDLMAIGVLRAAGELGRRVPDDLAVVGYDDIELASYTTPPLTTVSQSASEVGRAAVELLLQRLADPGRPPVRRTLETRLVVRASCGNQS